MQGSVHGMQDCPVLHLPQAGDDIAKRRCHMHAMQLSADHSDAGLEYMQE